MKSKQIIYIALVFIAGIFFFFKSYNKNQNITPKRDNYTRSNTEQPKETGKAAQTSVTENSDYDFNRNIDHIIYSRHARCRMDCRHIDESEIKEILAHGTVNKRKIETDSRGKTYPLEGVADGHHLRVVFAPKGENAVEVVTCIDLDTEWQCDCH